MSFTASLDQIVAENHNRLLGMRPGWARVRLKEVATILNGFPFESAKFKKDRGTPLLRIRDVVRGQTETFYDGKTDILIREGDRNVFIAECKIWKGEAELLKAIDQILGYLHWRDTKAALLVFNRNKAFSDILAKVPSAIQHHANCKKLIRQVGETEWRFLFSSKELLNSQFF